jgi:predicted ATPase
MIHRARFVNFKALRDVEATFDSRLTMLVGPNGCGKTSVLQGLHFLTQLAAVQQKDTDFAVATLHEYSSVGTRLEELTLELRGERSGWGSYEIELRTHDSQKLTCILVAEEEKRSEWRYTTRRHNEQWLSLNPVDAALTASDARVFDRSAFIRFSAARLAVPTLLNEVPPHVAKDGTGLAATLSHIKLKHAEVFDRIEEAFCRVIRGARRIRFDKALVPGTPYYSDTLLIDFAGVEGVKAAHVSSGTLFALGLLTVVLGPDSANVVLLDDLDHGLHPRAQLELIEVFRNLIDDNPDLQIVATAHSPYILDRLQPNEVRVMSLRDDGAAVCVPLTDHPEFERWRDAMSPGEFWSTFYEDWLTRKPEPQPAR